METLPSKIYLNIFVNITFLNKVTKGAVDQSNPGSALLYLKFQAILKDTAEYSNLVLPLKGMKDNEPIVISSYELQQAPNTTGVNINHSIESKNKTSIVQLFDNDLFI